MGVVIYRKVTNILEVPSDVFVNFIGDGLYVNREMDYFDDPESHIKIEVDAGPGLEFNESRQLTIGVGVGLEIKDNKVCVEEAVCDPTKTTEFRLLIDSCLTLDGQMLKMVKKYQVFTVEKNRTGRVINIVAGDITETSDDVLLNVCYGGYGYGGGSTSYRQSTKEEPNFYSK